MSSSNKKAAKIVAVKGWRSNPIEPSDAEIFDIPYVIRNWPPNWHKNAKKIKLIHSKFEEGIDGPDSINAKGMEKIQQNKVV